MAKRRKRRSSATALPRRRPAAPRSRQTGSAKNTAAALLQRELDEARQQLSEVQEQQSATSEVLRVISTSLGDLQPVFAALLDNGVRLCGAKFGTLYLCEGDALRMVAAHNVPAAYAESRRRAPFRPSRSGSLSGVMRTKQPTQIADLAATRAYAQRQPAVVVGVELGGARTVLGVPMLKDDELIGIINIYRQEVRPFTDKQVELVTSFAAQAVIAIENARLLNELRESLDRQTATADILRVIAGTPDDSRRALDTIAETASRMFDAVDVNFRRLEGNVLRFVCSAGPTGVRLRQALPDAPLEPTDPAVRCVFDNRQIAIADRRAVLANERGEIAGALRDLPVRSEVCTPLSREGKAIGVMIVDRSEVRPFRQDELELMRGALSPSRTRGS